MLILLILAVLNLTGLALGACWALTGLLLGPRALDEFDIRNEPWTR